MKVPKEVMDALHRYDAAMKDPKALWDKHQRAPFEEAEAVLSAIEKALDDAAMVGLTRGALLDAKKWGQA